MTDTVNKQAQERITERFQRSDGTMFVAYKGKFNPYTVPMTQAEILLPEHKPREILTDILERLAYYEDLHEFNPTPSTPVQGYREALEEIVTAYCGRDSRATMSEVADEMLAIARKALSHPDKQSSGWMPIESAPKDGSDILVLNNDGHVYEAAYEREIWRFAFANQHGCGCCGGDAEYPTHWMPLPKHPGINSTEDDQPGASISSTRLMLDKDDI